MVELNYQLYLYEQVKSNMGAIKFIDAFKNEYDTVNNCISKKLHKTKLKKTSQLNLFKSLNINLPSQLKITYCLKLVALMLITH